MEIARSKEGTTLYQRKYTLDLLDKCGMWGANTRPDISFVLRKLSQFLDCATSAHLQVANWVLRYLKSSSAYSLFLPAVSDLKLNDFTSSN